jgi:hypothetical protein
MRLPAINTRIARPAYSGWMKEKMAAVDDIRNSGSKQQIAMPVITSTPRSLSLDGFTPE